MNWGKWIVVAFLLFAGFIATLVTICVRQDISLVSSSYYKDELIYQDQIIRIKNVSDLSEKPRITLVGDKLQLTFGQLADVNSGELKLFRPSNASFDKVFAIPHSSNTTIDFDIAALPKGMYRIKFQWEMRGREYYFEDVIFI